MKNRAKLTLQKKRSLMGYLFILPWFVGFCIFYLRSMFMTARFSLSTLKMDAVRGSYTLSFAGLENFNYAFRVHGSFKQVLTSSVLNMLVDVPLIIFFSLFMAMLLNRKFKGRSIIRAIFFLPVILNSGAVTAAMDLSRQMMQGGVSTQVKETADMASAIAFDIDFLLDMFLRLGIPDKILTYLSTAVTRINDIIAASGVQIIIFIAALQSIPGSMYEVAKIEGATAYETFWKVTFPMVMPHIITNVVYTIVDSFTESEVVNLAYDVAFTEFNYGLSSVISIVSTVVTCLILILVCRFIQKRTFYYN
jgi:ABC-type sugar transport system permease subunit